MNKKQNSMGKIIAKALQDEAFKQRLIADTAAVLKAGGVKIPDGITVKVVVDTENVRHLVLPAMRKESLTDSELEMVAGGVRKGSHECGRDEGHSLYID